MDPELDFPLPHRCSASSGGREEAKGTRSRVTGAASVELQLAFLMQPWHSCHIPSPTWCRGTACSTLAADPVLTQFKSSIFHVDLLCLQFQSCPSPP